MPLIAQPMRHSSMALAHYSRQVRIILLGDSHLARVRRDLPRLACRESDCSGSGNAEILNAAVGGAFASDLRKQAATVGVRRGDRVVISIGTNDAAPWKQVTLADVTRQVEDFLVSITAERLVYLTPPGVDEVHLKGLKDRTNAAMATYGVVIADRLSKVGAIVVHGQELVKALGSNAFADDGVHLSGHGYDAVLPALASALCGGRHA